MIRTVRASYRRTAGIRGVPTPAPGETIDQTYCPGGTYVYPDAGDPNGSCTYPPGSAGAAMLAELANIQAASAAAQASAPQGYSVSVSTPAAVIAANAVAATTPASSVPATTSTPATWLQDARAFPWYYWAVGIAAALLVFERGK